LEYATWGHHFNAGNSAVLIGCVIATKKGQKEKIANGADHGKKEKDKSKKKKKKGSSKQFLKKGEKGLPVSKLRGGGNKQEKREKGERQEKNPQNNTTMGVVPLIQVETFLDRGVVPQGAGGGDRFLK